MKLLLGWSACFVFVAILLLASFLPLAAAWNHSTINITNYLFDDSYYYLGAAKSISEGHGSSVGGIVKTNGYQPAWMLLVTMLLIATTASTAGSIKALILFNGLVNILGAGRLLFFSKWPPKLRLALTISSAITILLFPWVFYGGLETVLFVLFIPFFLGLERFTKTGIWLGVAFFLLFLVRLDAASIFLAWLLIPNRNDQESNIRNIFTKTTSVASVVFFGLAAVYFLINHFYFGASVPISGLSKALGNKAGENLPVSILYAIQSAPNLAILILCYMIALLTGRKSDYPFNYQIKLFALSSTVCAIYYGLLSGWRVWGWYYWPIAFLTLFSITKLIYALAEIDIVEKIRTRKFDLKAIAVVFLFIAVFVFISKPVAGIVKNLVALRPPTPWANDSAYNTVSYRSVGEFFSTVKPGVVGMGDRSGGLAYFLPKEFGFIHLEGLVSDQNFLNARKNNQAIQFLKNEKLKYLVEDREQFFEAVERGEKIYGIAEPIQASSIHEGSFLICQPEKSILYQTVSSRSKRIVFDFDKSVECPSAIASQFKDKVSHYEMLRYFSIPSEYKNNPPYQMKLLWSDLLKKYIERQ